jgi:hypothetical protein
LPDDAEYMFNRMDRNKDGVVDVMEFCHAMSVDGTAAADPRVFLFVKYLLCKAVFVNFCGPGAWSEEVQCDGLVMRFTACGVHKDPVRQAYLSMVGRGHDNHVLISPAQFVHVCLTHTSPDKSFPKVLGPLYGQLTRVFQVSAHSMLSVDLFVTLVARAGIDSERAQAVFSMIDVDHMNVLQWEFFLATLGA